MHGRSRLGPRTRSRSPSRSRLVAEAQARARARAQARAQVRVHALTHMKPVRKPQASAPQVTAETVRAVAQEVVAVTVQATHEELVKGWTAQAKAAIPSGEILSASIMRIDFDELQKAVERVEHEERSGRHSSHAMVLRSALPRLMMRLKAASTMSKTELLALAAPAEATSSTVVSGMQRVLSALGHMGEKAAKFLGLTGLGGALGAMLGYGIVESEDVRDRWRRFGQLVDFETFREAYRQRRFHVFGQRNIAFQNIAFPPMSPDIADGYKWLPLLLGGLGMAVAGGLQWVHWRNWKIMNEQAAAVGAVARTVDFWVELQTLAHSQAEALRELGLAFDYATNTFRALSESPTDTETKNLMFMRHLQAGDRPVFVGATHKCRILTGFGTTFSRGGRRYLSRATARVRARSRRKK